MTGDKATVTDENLVPFGKAACKWSTPMCADESELVWGVLRVP